MVWLALPYIRSSGMLSYPMPNKLNISIDYFTICIIISLVRVNVSSVRISAGDTLIELKDQFLVLGLHPRSPYTLWVHAQAKEEDALCTACPVSRQGKQTAVTGCMVLRLLPGLSPEEARFAISHSQSDNNQCRPKNYG